MNTPSKFWLTGLLCLFSLSLFSQEDKWFYVMTGGDYQQAYKHWPTFPENWVDEKAGEGKALTSVAFGNVDGEQKWLLVASADQGITHQRYIVQEEFPNEFISDKWDEDYDLAQVAFGDGNWAVVMNKGLGYCSQSWGKRESLEEIRQFIREKWDKDKYLTSMTYGNGEWVAVMSKCVDITSQSYKFSDTYPNDWIQEKYDDDYNLTTVAYGEGVWFIVMSKFPGGQIRETCGTKDNFPSTRIKELWDDEKRITSIVFNLAYDPQERFDELFNAGLAAAEREDYEEAIDYYNRALLIKPNDATTLNNLGWTKYLNGQCYGGLSDVKKSISIEANEYSYHTRGAIYLCLERYHEALEDFDKAIESAYSEKHLYYADRARAWRGMGSLEDALRDVNRALQLDSGNGEYLRLKRDIEEELNSYRQPVITWDYPIQKFTPVETGTYEVKVCVQSGANIESAYLYVNGTTFKARGITVERDCDLAVRQDVNLQRGRNEVKLVVNTSAGQYSSDVRVIEYNARETSNYYGLFIGVESYDDWAISDLDNPYDDASQLSQVLSSKYNFSPGNVKLMKDPTKQEIIDQLLYYQQALEPDDNLLIFYSGHGEVKKNVGYWLPSNAENDNPSTWFSNGELRDYINSMDAQHVLVIADACFSGSIVTGGYKNIRSFNCEQMEKLPSRRAFTSGAISVVPDNSIFIQYLLKKLDTNTESCMSAEELYQLVKPAVIYNSPNNHVPQFGALPFTGDEGGNFIFKKN
jgi:tetratricopeptide (TPR) repeat protein